MRRKKYVTRARRPRTTRGAKTSHQRRFGAAAKRCAGTGKRFQACMKREMR